MSLVDGLQTAALVIITLILVLDGRRKAREG
jgi:hypothetical protein